MRWRPERLAALAGALALLAAGCGYRTLTDTPGRIRSVSVVPFVNRTLYTGLEFELQEALVKEWQAKSAVAIVPASHADALLEGVVLDFGRSVIKQDAAGRDTEFQITVTAGFTLRERLTRKCLSESQGVSVSGTYLVTRGESEPAARARAMSDLAERIVSMILYAW